MSAILGVALTEHGQRSKPSESAGTPVRPPGRSREAYDALFFGHASRRAYDPEDDVTYLDTRRWSDLGDA